MSREPKGREPVAHTTTFLATLVVGFCFGCNRPAASANSTEDGKQHRDVRVEHEACDVQASGAEKLDANADGRPDITIVRDNGREVCRAADINFDGAVDTFSYFDDGGRLRRREHDFDRDGKVDEITVFQNGVVAEKFRATSVAGQLDTWEFYANGLLARTERDSDGDAIIDQWWEYAQSGCPMMHTDANRDGRPDPGATIDYCKDTGYVPPERQNYRQVESPNFRQSDALPTETEVKEVPTPESGAAPSPSKAAPGGAGGKKP